MTQTSVLADGCFDPLHVGHLAYLQAAAAFGWPLVVRIAPDEEILAKGRVPFQTQEERARVIRAWGCVGRVTLAPTLAEAIREQTPRYLVKGAAWRDRLPPDIYRACDEVGTMIVFVNTEAKSSTTRLSV